MAKLRSKFESSRRHEEVKRADRIRKKSRARTLNFDANNEVTRFCSKVSVFKELINSGPYYICVACNRCLYRRSVGLFDRNKFFPISDDVFNLVLSIDGNFYICKTCGKKLNKNCVPCQSVCNMLEVCELPKVIKDIQRLERIFVARRLLFKKINIMPKGQSPKFKGALCNIPVDVIDVCDTLPCPADSNGIIIAEIERKLQYRGQVSFESVRLNFILKFL